MTPPLDERERAVLAAIEAADDRRVASPELATAVWQDFGTLWELSPYRTTVLDALGFTHAAAGTALELGGGVGGTVTRWLGERFARVDAHEPSARHAAVTAARVRDLAATVTVRTTAPDATDAYDLVTLLGAGAADSALLETAWRALRADGGLAVVAVANPDGLKYNNGAERDDDAGTRVAFSTLGELEVRARAAGFAALDVLLPFPDHRLTSTILDPAAFADDPDAANWLLGTAPNRGAAPRRRVVHDSETLLQREAILAGRLIEQANAYVLLCWRGSPPRVAARLGVERGWRARHWSLDRRPACRKRVTLTAAGTIANETTGGGPAREPGGPAIDLGVIEHRIADEPRRSGPVLAFAALDALAAGEELSGLVERYARWLVGEFGTDQVDGDGVPLLDGAALDAIWTNVIDDRTTGRWAFVDREWAFRGVLPLDFLVWRALADLPARFPHEARVVDAYDITRAAGVMPDVPGRLELALELQDAFHSAAGTGATPEPPARVRALAEDGAAVPRPRFRILARAEEFVAQPALLAAYARVFAGAALATLVLFAADDAPSTLPALQGAIAAAGLDEDTMPDTLLVDADADQDGEAVLTATGWGPPRLARFAPDELPALRALADRRATS